MTLTSRSIVLLLIIYCEILCASGGRNYCHSGRKVTIEIAKRRLGDETLVARQEPSSLEPLALPRPATCRWLISCAGLSNPPVQLALLAVEDDVTGNGGNPLVYWVKGKFHSVTAGLLHGVALRDDTCSIPVSSNQSTQQLRGGTPPSLRAVRLLPGYCAPDMLAFRRSCYAVGAFRGSLEDAVYGIRGTAQLASFTSEADIISFITANTARATVHPYNKPLDLTEPVRISLFFRPGDGVVLSLARSRTSFRLQPAPSIKKFQVTGGSAGLLCGSLSVPANASTGSNWTINFSSCTTPMRSLVNFLDVRLASISRTAWSSDLPHVLAAAYRQRRGPQSPNSSQFELRTSSSISDSSKWMAIGIALFSAALFAVFVVSVAVYSHRKFCHQPDARKTGGTAEPTNDALLDDANTSCSSPSSC